MIHPEWNTDITQAPIGEWFIGLINGRQDAVMFTAVTIDPTTAATK